MKTIAHISDLHFGTEDPAATEDLCRDLRSLEPSLLVVSGDLTQRARRNQFQAAHDFLDRLPSPQLVVPGNHDVPLYDVVRRFVCPLGRFRRHISPEPNPCYQDEDMIVLGLNTARSLTWKNGRISNEQMDLAMRIFGREQKPLFKILVTHHPFIPPPGEDEGAVDLVGRAENALLVLDACGVDLLLAGHLHHGYSGDIRTYHPATRRSMIVAQAGTATSKRLRQEPNAYNLITIDKDRMRIAVRVCRQGTFVESTAAEYRLEIGEWKLVNGARKHEIVDQYP